MEYDMDNEFDNEYPDKDIVPPLAPFMGPPNNFGNNRYRFAYGAYRGGYGSVGGRGGFGPQNNFRPPPPYFGPNSSNFFDSQGPGLWPRGSAFPSRPQKNEAIKYLIKCGVPREHLRNLPRDLLRMINPDYCGLCAVEFDSYSLSRVHYNSKNHLKNMKKWQNSQEFGNYSNKSAPLKSRELYCELCDVEITSKPHSESHYAGRSHRAIVEGRKNPKNPLLLQPGLEDRVKQLIRREKKYLIPIEESDLEEKPKADNKPIAPELFCEICKTFVTCSEQMTLHLNGKKHLTKEKQYILRMMKGDESVNVETQSKDESVQQSAGDPEDYEDKDEETEVNNDDWEKNGEKWDEPETKT